MLTLTHRDVRASFPTVKSPLFTARVRDRKRNRQGSQQYAHTTHRCSGLYTSHTVFKAECISARPEKNNNRVMHKTNINRNAKCINSNAAEELYTREGKTSREVTECLPCFNLHDITKGWLQELCILANTFYWMDLSVDLSVNYHLRIVHWQARDTRHSPKILAKWILHDLGPLRCKHKTLHLHTLCMSQTGFFHKVIIQSVF